MGANRGPSELGLEGVCEGGWWVASSQEPPVPSEPSPMVCADQFVHHPPATLVLKARAAAPLQPLASHWDNASFRCVFCLLWRMDWRRRLEAGGTSLGAEGYHGDLWRVTEGLGYLKNSI